ncbi:phage tail sheath subtilisin-like domain-containing protein [Clostridium ihumii]|uniref:phage tail sheath subtilisin-like domain-containing protein n=1 Tax=Clostridium ihumii TaxID=1470356 RepID=UPI00055100A1|nr:phage tail sheath subtilisin-like domain-containing protein [Clostridium ihumii]
MGLPSIEIIFKSLGASAIERSSKGTVALILRDTKTTENVITIESIKEIPKELNESNKEQIELAFKGGYRIPQKIMYYSIAAEESIEKALEKLEAEVWDYLAVPFIEENEIDKVATWIKGLRQDNIKVQAVLPNCKADSEGIINITTEKFITKTKEYSTKDYCSRFAGIFAGTPLNISATYFVLQELRDIYPHLRKSDANKKIDSGELIVINDGEKCKIGRAVNSLTTTSEGKGEEYKKVKIVSTMDLIDRDIRRTFENDYIGKYDNSYDNQVLFSIGVNGYLETLEDDKILAKRQNSTEINDNKLKAYFKNKGIDVEKLNKQDLEELGSGSNVFLKGKCRPLDAMEDLSLEFEM